MSAPQIIAGPAIIQHGGQVYYSEGDITVSLARDTFLVSSACHGTIDERLVSQMVTLAFKPVSCLDVVAKYLPFAVTQIGTLLINQSEPASVVVWARDGRKTTWGAGFVSQLPSFNLSAVQVPVGDMQIVAIGNPVKDLTDAAAWNTFAEAAFADTSFNETTILTPKYLATWGEIFEDLESETGFLVEPAMSFSMKSIANWGNVNALLTDITIGVRFTPVGLDEDDLWAALRLQGSDAITPGDSLTKDDEDLVISGGGVSFTLHNAGPKTGITRYGLEPLRIGEVAFVTRRTWTAGVADPLFTVAFS